ncbi:hypothetical protein PSN45_003249 [Yamadazyma tenuis]|uniref:Small-subunit processome n=1 Tax=Candida tenuis (strain ATCC 10573 / BCRC 21748 / CBS 615 / JCM 9827 / NBRC 10315 / NRRL Y-1498 / VKM Y-70) TaxID=590646 RepID=G3AYW3_CANTC|nr:uncharacterized protein CANTEDRAFT_101725 [Yamadazyma tenuis ATCC 10573]EGV65946.1 hypothetical protein CANTEDRAFT_101725 [Yamadazyma tenuis ATCC 10573]WEJ95722.1 hypothetical protein PSN45_003249 [Yamadazyma tenuis]
MAKKTRQTGKSKAKRSNQKILNAFEIAERQENGSDSDGNSGDDDYRVQDGVLDASKFLNNAKKEDFSDDEIDSDEALGSDDDYDILNSKFSQSIRDKEKKLKSRAQRRRRGEKVESESDESDDGYSSIDEDQLVGLSEAWDMDDKDLAKSKMLAADKDVVLDDAWESASSEESESDDESGSESESEEDIFGDDSGNEVDLSNTLTHLKSQLKMLPKERKKLISETIIENEFSLPTNGNKLSINDMISAVDTSVSKDAILIDNEESSGSKALDTPLPVNIQQKHERRAAYEITKEEVSKWEDTVQQNRQAEVLKFPLNPTIKHNDTATTFRSTNDPTTDLEKKIHSVLTESALTDDKKEATFEELAVAKMSPEEMKERTNELRLMRELMFREETRARRIKKIKSKTFRKIKKKERLRDQDLVEGSDESDKEDHDRKRAEERMNLKHKTQSKWAKSLIKSGLSKDSSNREELEEMLRQGERLRTKQLGYEDGDQSDNNASDIERDYEEEETISNTSRAKLGKGVLAMDFMKAAEERHRQENLQEIEMLKKLENGEDLQQFSEDVNSINVIKNQGRRVYNPTAADGDINAVNKRARQEIEDDESSNLLNKLSKKAAIVINKPEETRAHETEPQEEANPWLIAGDTKRSSKVRVVDKDSSKQEKTLNKMKKKSVKSKIGENLEIDVGETLGFELDNSDDDERETFKQLDLIKDAFAGDNVVTEFQREKKRVVKDEDDKEEDVSLPGWGDWAGGKKQKKRKIVKKINGVVQKDNRRDKNMKNVIINEKMNKKNLKYQSADVPYPYESREQYERALRMPIGQEWTSRETHQRMTMPRVITKQGTVIDPLKAPFK